MGPSQQCHPCDRTESTVYARSSRRKRWPPIQTLEIPRASADTWRRRPSWPCKAFLYLRRPVADSDDGTEKFVRRETTGRSTQSSAACYETPIISHCVLGKTGQAQPVAGPSPPPFHSIPGPSIFSALFTVSARTWPQPSAVRAGRSGRRVCSRRGGHYLSPVPPLPYRVHSALRKRAAAPACMGHCCVRWELLALLCGCSFGLFGSPTARHCLRHESPAWPYLAAAY